MLATAVKYLMYYSKVQEINDVQSLVIKANNEADATFVKSKTLDGYGEIPVLGNIFTKLMVNTLTKERITDSGEDNPFKTTRDEMSDFGWFSGYIQFNGLDFYLDGDDTTASTIAPSIAKTSITPYGGAFSYGDITKAWKFQQAIYIIKATGKDLKDYYLNKNCNKKSNSYNMIDPIYSKKYKLYYNGTTVANSTAIKFVDNDGNELKDNDTIYIGINSFMRDNRAKDYFHKYSAHSDKACVTVSTDWVIKHPATGEDYHINGYYGNTFAFIYSARLLGGYDETNKDKVMIDLTDPTSIYHFDPTEHFVHFYLLLEINHKQI